MADPKGFLTTPRITPKRRPIDVRILDWKEVYEPQDMSELKNKPDAVWIAAFRSVIRAVRSET